MMFRRKNKVCCLLGSLLLFTGLYADAQIGAFKYKAHVQKPDSSGVYRIELNPDLVAKSREDLQDIRLIDNSGKNTAYVLSNRLRISSPDSFIILPEVKSGDQIDTAVVYIVSNFNAFNINRLWLSLKRTDVNRVLTLTGSDDLKKWFAIKEGIPLQGADIGAVPNYMQSMDFPTSNYRYFKIEVSGKNKTPVKILRVGVYAASLNIPTYDAIPPIKFSKKEIAGETSLFLNLSQAYQVNKLHINVNGPKYYSRRIVVSEPDQERPALLVDTIVSSTGPGDILLSVKAKKLRVDIYNGDDNPLQISSIEGYQLKEFAVAYLEAGHTYDLFTGNSTAKAVIYDLSFLNNHAFNQLPGVTHSKVNINPAFLVPRQLRPTKHTVWLWASIIVVLIVLCFLTFRMAKEIKRA